MWRILAAVLILAVAMGPAAAAERVLLSPQDLTSATARSAPPASLKALRAAAASQDRVQVIVGLKVPFAAEGLLPAAVSRQQRAEIATATTGIRSRFAAAINRAPQSFRSYTTLPFVAMEVTAQELERLAADPEVISISENSLNQTLLTTSVQMIGGDDAHSEGYVGSGHAVAVLDTGVDKNHPFLSGRVVAEACFSTTGRASTSLCPGGAASSTAPGSGMPCSIIGCDHGTHVAGIAAGSSTTMKGVAPAANIIAIKVFSNISGVALSFDADISAALEHVLMLSTSQQIAAVNMSLGGGRYLTSCDANLPVVKAAIDNLRSVGIATIIASGNNGYKDSLSAPACISSAVSVGAVSTKDWGNCTGSTVSTARDKVACYSNSAPMLSLLAPGTKITSSIPNQRFDENEGTSMAAPHVAGAWALLKQRAPNATVGQALQALQSSGTRVRDYRNSIVKSRINVNTALDRMPTGLSYAVLSLSMSGSAAGTVTFSPSGTTDVCTESCTSTFTIGRQVTLTARAPAGASFVGWSGDCSGTAPCQLTMAAVQNVTAEFRSDVVGTMALNFVRAGQGEGTVTFSPGGSTNSCSGSCINMFAPKATVTLTAQPAPGSVFVGWSNSCKRRGVCTVRMSKARTVTARFEPVAASTLTYTRLGDGTGDISVVRPTGSPGCSASCTLGFEPGAKVRLMARAAAGSTFTGWGGACRGMRSCSVVMSEARNVTASFATASSSAVALDYVKTGQGQGTVSFSPAGSQASCGDSCTTQFPPRTRVTLSAQAAPGSVFIGWSNGCRGKKNCRVRMTTARSVTARFEPLTTQALTLIRRSASADQVTVCEGPRSC